MKSTSICQQITVTTQLYTDRLTEQDVAFVLFFSWVGQNYCMFSANVQVVPPPSS